MKIKSKTFALRLLNKTCTLAFLMKCNLFFSNVPVLDSPSEDGMCFSKEGSQERDQYVENISSFFIDVINNITEKYAQEKEEQRQRLYASMEIKRVDSLDINKNEKKNPALNQHITIINEEKEGKKNKTLNKANKEVIFESNASEN